MILIKIINWKLVLLIKRKLIILILIITWKLILLIKWKLLKLILILLLHNWQQISIWQLI